MARGDRFRSGETVFFSFQVSGYEQSAAKAVRLSYRVEAFDPHGVRIEAPVESIFDATLHEEDKHWMPKLRVPIAIPPVAPPGTYKIVVQVTDDISHLTAMSETEFQVDGHEVPPSAELTIRNFNFYRTEGDSHPVSVAAYHPGDSLFARFDISGFRYAAENTIHVFYDVALVNPAGKTIYAQDHAAEDRSFSYYPKPYVPGEMSLSLEANMRAGVYTLIVTAHDEVGHQKFEAKQAFTVE